MRIELTVGVRVVDPVAGNPGNGPALNGEGPANDQQALQPAVRREALVREHPVEPERDSE